jgi:hypothetical protein
VLGFISLGIGLANLVFSRDPRSFDRALPSGAGQKGLGGWAAAKAALLDVRSVLVVPTFAIIITQVSRACLSIGPRGLDASKPCMHARSFHCILATRFGQRFKRLLCMHAQGIIGNIPGQAMAFLTLYLQLLGMSNLQASLLVSLMMGAHALGGQLGGWLGDLAAARAPHAGRVVVCQFSVAAGQTPLARLTACLACCCAPA